MSGKILQKSQIQPVPDEDSEDEYGVEAIKVPRQKTISMGIIETQ